MKRLNKKGFTLIELLAVIVILAVIILIAASNIGAMTSKAKKSVLAVEGNTLVDAAKTAYQMGILDGEIANASKSACFSLTYLNSEGYFDKGSKEGYNGSVLVTASDDAKTYSYKFWISDKSYSFTGVNEAATGSKADATRNPASETCGMAGTETTHYFK